MDSFTTRAGMAVLRISTVSEPWMKIRAYRLSGAAVLCRLFVGMLLVRGASRCVRKPFQMACNSYEVWIRVAFELANSPVISVQVDLMFSVTS